MSDTIKLNTEEVLSIANKIEADNQELLRILNESKATIDALGTSWTGPAAESTRAAYDSFSTKYFDAYQKTLNQYVTFLRTNVAGAYETTETQNKKLGDAFNR